MSTWIAGESSAVGQELAGQTYGSYNASLSRHPGAFSSFIFRFFVAFLLYLVYINFS